MRRTLVLVMLLMVAACQSPVLGAKAKPATPESIALQPGDVSGLQRCSASGDVAAVLQDERVSNPTGYDINATEWAQWRMQGASDAYLAAYGRTADDCQALSAAGTGAPTGGVMLDLIVKFKSEATATRTFGAESTLLGFGPKDIAFIRLVGGTVMIGADTGFGPRSVIGTGTATGTTYYVAFWQNKTFDSFLIAYDMAADDVRVAADKVYNRIR